MAVTPSASRRYPSSRAAVALLHIRLLPFYHKLDLPVHTIVADNGREFCGTERHAYNLYLALNDIAHRKARVGSPRANGFVEHSNGTVALRILPPGPPQAL
jgi:hypothetical protein